MSKTSLVFLSVAVMVGFGSGCNGGGSAAPAAVKPTTISPTQFVSQLVADAQSGAAPSAYADSTLLKGATLVANVFVIYDSATGEDETVFIQNGENAGDTPEQLVKSYIANDQYTYGGNPQGLDPRFGTGSYDAEPGVVAPDAQQPGLYISSGGTLYSQDSNTRDTDLQQAQLQNTSFLQRAAKVSTSYQMSFSSALQLTLLADKINAVTEGSLTDQDRQAITQSTLTIAGVSSDDLTSAVTASMGGDDTLSNNLLTKISQNLGMPSDTTLRSQILPMLGVSLSK
jgi:hypothetical protein